MPSVLFVCTANRIRSPLAEHIFWRQLAASTPDPSAWQVGSAGVWTRPGLAAMPLAKQVAAELGIDLSAHRSRRIDDVALEEFEVIITMEQGQQEALRVEFPAAAPRVQLLSQLGRGLVYDVADPIGRPVDAYRTAAREIEQLLISAQQQIMGLAQTPPI